MVILFYDPPYFSHNGLEPDYGPIREEILIPLL
jgi:hypothetical protein